MNQRSLLIMHYQMYIQSFLDGENKNNEELNILSFEQWKNRVYLPNQDEFDDGDLFQHTPYIVQNTENQFEFWNNEFGWCDILSATQFTENEKQFSNPPIDGKFVPFWEVTLLQACRLISEAESIGIWQNNIDALLQVTDLEESDLIELINRCQNIFDEFNQS